VLVNKDMLVVPLGHGRERQDRDGKPIVTGPICVVLSPTKMELSKDLSDLW
jgi:hypothetical protein